MRIAVVSTPRSGNTWFRMLLARLYNLEERAIHTPDAIDWNDLPTNCSLQIHWHKTPEFQALCSAHDFRVVTIARHPIDVLVSVLHFAPHEPQTAQWLRGEGGDERAIYLQSPVSQEFLQYAISKRARALLSVAAEWWNAPGIAGIRYESLVSETSTSIDTLLKCLGPAVANIDTVLQSLSLERLRQQSSNQHFWRGTPWLWRSLVPQHVADRIQEANADIFRALGYSCNADPNVTEESARQAWLQL